MVLCYLAPLCWGLYELGKYAVSFITLQQYRCSKFSEFVDDEMDEGCVCLTIMFGPVIMGMAWPLTFIAALYFGILYGGRHLYRKRDK